MCNLNRLIQWAYTHQEDWAYVCGTNDLPVSEEEYERIAKALLKEGFPEAYYIFFCRFCHLNGINLFPKM